MLGSEILDLAVGMLFIYLLMAIICTALRETLEAWMKTRAAYLEHGIRELLHDHEGTGLTTRIYNHPLIFGLFNGEYRPRELVTSMRGLDRPPMRTAKKTTLPSYIPAGSFAVAVLDIAARGPSTDAVSSDATSAPMSARSIRANIANLENESVQRIVLTALDAAGDNINAARAHLEAWFNGAMDRISGWYTRSTKWIIFAISLAITIALNVNSITIADYLYRDGVTRAAIVAHVSNVAADPSLPSSTYDRARGELESIGLPIGWSNGWGAPMRANTAERSFLWNDLFAPILGWLITAFAAAMGAPFWFDLLNKVMVVRSTVKPREKSREEASEDRQLRPAFAGASTFDGSPFAPFGTTGVAQPSPLAPGGAFPPAAGEPIGMVAPPIVTPADEATGVDSCVTLSLGPETADEDLPSTVGGVEQ